MTSVKKGNEICQYSLKILPRGSLSVFSDSVSFQICGDLFCLLKKLTSKKINVTSMRDPRFRSRLSVYIFISFFTIFLSEEDAEACKTRSFTKRKKKTRLWTKL